jgi:hypothetical protein
MLCVLQLRLLQQLAAAVVAGVAAGGLAIGAG